MNKIYHITSIENWKKSKKLGEYRFCSLQKEGFIHCSTSSQFIRIANGLFKGRNDTLLLEIDESKVVPEIIYENLEGGVEQFPHIYGPLNLNAVINVYKFASNSQGTFTSPL